MKNEIYIISIIIFICYHKSLHHQFVFDDNFAIVKNKDIHQCNIYNIFSHDYWGMEINIDISFVYFPNIFQVLITLFNNACADNFV